MIKSWKRKNVLLIELIIALKLYYIRTLIPSKKFQSDPTSIFILFGNGNKKKHVKVTRPVPIIHNLLALKKNLKKGMCCYWYCLIDGDEGSWLCIAKQYKQELDFQNEEDKCLHSKDKGGLGRDIFER